MPYYTNHIGMKGGDKEGLNLFTNNTIYHLILLVISVQYIVTYYYTNGKHFSIRALIRNLSFTISIYLYYITNNIIFIVIPFILEIFIENLKLKGYHIEKYIATKYQYDDYWREICKKNPIFTNLTEGNYDKILGFDTTNTSSQNYKKILDWSQKLWKLSYDNNISYVIDINNNKHDPLQLKNYTDNAKFKLICDICKIKQNMRILEIGFGEGDFIMYIKNNYNTKPIGVSISTEQVNMMKNKGYEAYALNMWDMTSEKLGTFDLIIQCGNLEYTKCSGDTDYIYEKYSKIIFSLLKPGGKYFITCLHLNEDFKYDKFNDWYNVYFLWSGNDGYYPRGPNGFSKHAQKAGLHKLFQQDRTCDYLIATIIFFTSFQFINNTTNNRLSLAGFTNSLIKTIAAPYYLHTYLCYSPSSYYHWLPFSWEFIPQLQNNKYITPVTLQYILFQR
jgi:cyclopropane fatty-acyl-phospholipid synthase-like methyltransferase